MSLRDQQRSRWRGLQMLAFALFAFGSGRLDCWAQQASLADVVTRVQPNVVKLFGAGGLRGLEAYQTGVLISGEGHILTAWSYVLDTDDLRAVLHDGRRYTAKLLGADPRLEVALLKVDAENLPHFELDQAPLGKPGSRILAFSNLFGVATGNEAVSVQQGTIALATNLTARRGIFETPYRGQVYVLDAITNNPGAAGGALTDTRGQLLGVLGKELRNSLNNTWLSYAVPIAELRNSVEEILAGSFHPRESDADEAKPANPWTADLLGLVLVPNVIQRTPAYVDLVQARTPAAAAGLLPDDLVVFVNEHLVHSCEDVLTELEYLDRADPVRLTVMRQQSLVELVLEPRP